MHHAKLIAGQTRAAARHRRRLDLRPAIGAHDGHHRRHHLVERREARARQGARRGLRHQLQDHAGMGQGGARLHRRPRRRSGARGRRRRHADPLVRRDPRRRQDQHHRRLERRRERIQRRTDLLQARQRAGDFRRLDADVRGDERRHRREPDQAGDRPRVRLRRRRRRPSGTWRPARISAKSSSASAEREVR